MLEVDGICVVLGPILGNRRIIDQNMLHTDYVEMVFLPAELVNQAEN